MDWFKDRYPTVIEALTAPRVLWLGAIFSIATGAAHLAPQISWAGHPMLLDTPSWAWGTIAALIAALYFLFEYAHRKRTELVPRIRLSFDQHGMGIVLSAHQPSVPAPGLKEPKSSWVRIRADAQSKRTVRGCSAFVTALEKRPSGTTAFTPVPLPQSIFIDFLMSGDWDNKLVATCHWPFILRDVFNDIATYRFTFVINGDGVSQTMKVDVGWNGKWDSITAAELKPG